MDRFIISAEQLEEIKRLVDETNEYKNRIDANVARIATIIGQLEVAPSDAEFIASNALFEEEEDSDVAFNQIGTEDVDVVVPQTNTSDEEKAVVESDAMIAETPIVGLPLVDAPTVSVIGDEDGNLMDVNDSTFARVTGSDINKAFSINDRYRFRRELFGNSDFELNDALNLILTMGNPEEAEEYFYTELGWDPENPEVKDFMHIVSTFLSHR